MNKKIIGLPKLIKVSESTLKISWDDGDHIKEKVIQLLKDKGVYKEGLAFAAYDTDKYNKIKNTGLAFPEFTEELYATFLDEHDETYVAAGAISYVRDLFKNDEQAILAVYDLEIFIDINAEPSNLKPVNKTRPLNGLIGIIKLELEE